MKIAVVVTGGLHPSGREQVVPSWLALFAALAPAHDIHAFALRHLPTAQSYPLLGFMVHDLGRPSAPFGLARRARERALLQAMAVHGPFDLVHGFWGDPAGHLAVRAARALGIPSLVTFDSGEFVSLPDIDYGSQRTRRGQQAVTAACTATRAHVCTGFMAEQATRFGVMPIVVPLTTVAGSRDPGAGTRDPARRFWRDHPLRLLQVASLSRVKNQRTLIDALAIVRGSIDATLDLVGEDALGGDLQRHAAARRVAEFVAFHGFVPQDRLATFYRDADLYVQSSLHEAAGVSVLEAAAAGLPIAGTRAGFIADWAPDRATATDTADADGLARAILALHADPARARTMAAKAQAWSRAHDVTWVAGRFESLYQELV